MRANLERHGFRLLPLASGTNRPALREWQKQASSDPAVLDGWALERPGCNWGILTGNGLGVLDLDTKNDPWGFGGYSTLIELGDILNVDLSGLPLVQTASGAHLYFRYEGVLPSRVPWLPFIDLKADGGHQVAAPGTIRTDVPGEPRTYELVRGDLGAIPVIHEALLSAMRGWRITHGTTGTRSPSSGDDLPSTDEALENGLPVNSRNDFMHRLACRWWGLYEGDGDRVRDLAYRVWQATPNRETFPWSEALVAVHSAERFMHRQRDNSVEEIIAMLGLSQ